MKPQGSDTGIVLIPCTGIADEDWPDQLATELTGLVEPRLREIGDDKVVRVEWQ